MRISRSRTIRRRRIRRSRTRKRRGIEKGEAQICKRRQLKGTKEGKKGEGEENHEEERMIRNRGKREEDYQKRKEYG